MVGKLESCMQNIIHQHGQGIGHYAFHDERSLLLLPINISP